MLTRFPGRVLRGALLALAVSATIPAASTAAPGDLLQKSGLAACISEDGSGGACTDGFALAGPSFGTTSVAVSPDGKNAYAAAGDGVAIFDRATDGALTQKAGPAGCITDNGAGGCTPGQGMGGAFFVTVSPDGANVYVAALNDNSVANLERASDGTLSQDAGNRGCVSWSGADGCVLGRGLERATSVTVSPDGLSVYVTSAGFSGSAIAILDRGALGSLTQKPGTAGCISSDGATGCGAGRALRDAVSVVVAPGGTNVYVAGASSTVAVFDRIADGTLTQKSGASGCLASDVFEGSGNESCTGARSLTNARSIALSPDGRNAYVAASNAGVAILDRSSDGTLTQKPGADGCIDDSTFDGCALGQALSNSFFVTTSPDGASVYVGSSTATSLALFDRAFDGSLTQKAAPAGCIAEQGTATCSDGTAITGVRSIAVSPDGENAYTAALNSRAVAVFDREASVAPQEPASAGVSDGVLEYDGADAGAADAAIEQTAPGAFTVTVDPAVTARTGCAQTSATVATCTGVSSVVATTGAGTDSLTAAGADVPVTITDAGGVAQSFTGGEANDLIQAGPGNATVAGGGGHDRLVDVAASAVTYVGGLGFDRVDYTADTAGLVVTIGAAPGDGPGGTDDVQSGVEAISGGAGGDAITGDGNPNTLAGFDGADTLLGGDGNDFLGGGTLQDVINANGSGTADSDTMRGGNGADTVTYSYLPAGTPGVYIGASAGDGTAGVVSPDQARAFFEADVVAGIERFNGSPGYDIMVGNDAPGLTFVGFGGRNELFGTPSADFMDAGTGVSNSYIDCAGGTDTYRVSSVPAGRVANCEVGI